MFEITTGYHKDCEGFSRRDFIRVGTAGLIGLSLADLLALKSIGQAQNGKATACILLWMSGGPSHVDTFDPKPEAPEMIHGPFGAIETNVSGIRIGEHLPMLAKHAEKFALLRSVTHPRGDHEGGHFYMQTGFQPPPTFLQFEPHYGSVVAAKKGFRTALPPYVAIPGRTYGGGAGYLGRPYEPFEVAGDPNDPNFRVRDANAPVPVQRVDRRKSLLNMVDSIFKTIESADMKGRDAFYQRAFTLMGSPEAKAAFDLKQEPDEVRNAYGRSSFGQSCLLARRLVERGVSFVTIDRGNWDTHGDNFNILKNNNLPDIDRGMSALLDDLAKRGLLESTLVVWMGEFGRTPRINGSVGRDHWPYAQTTFMAGGGIQGGQVVGESDAYAEFPKERPLKPEDVAATIYHCLGIDPEGEIMGPNDRPMKLVVGGEVIREVV